MTEFQMIEDEPEEEKQQNDFREVVLSENERKMLFEQNSLIQKMLYDLGCIEMDFDSAKTRIKHQIEEQKAKLNVMLHDKAVMSGAKDDENLRIEVDFNAGKLKFQI
jgi:hypothetical protein